MYKDMLNAAVIAAVNTVTDKSDDVKEDIVGHLIEAVFTGEQIEGVAQQIFDMINKLGDQFETMPRKKAQLAGYLLEHLDIPREAVSTEITQQLLDAAVAGSQNESIAVLQSDIDFEALPNQSVSAIREVAGDKESPIKNTVIFVKVSKLKLLLFVLADSISAFSVTKTGVNLLVEELSDYGVGQFSQTLETLKDGEYAPKLMSDRESVLVNKLDVAWATSFLNDNPGVLNGRAGKSAHELLDVIVSAYVDETELDVTGKRIELEHLDALMAFANETLAERPPVASDGIEDAVVVDEPVVSAADEDDSLFSKGVAEQTEETAAPVTVTDEVVASDEIEDAVIIEDEPVDMLDSAQVAVGILKELAQTPERTALIIANSPLSIKDTLYREVFNTLPSVQKRASDTYTELETETIKTELNDHIRDVLAVVNEYKTKMEEEHLASLPYSTEMVNSVIVDSPVHSSFLENETLDKLVVSVTDYLNGNSEDTLLTGDEPKRRIGDVLRKLSLYDYESEALINPTYRATNVPPADKLIRNTKVIARTLTKTYTSTTVWNSEQAKLVEHAYAEIFNNGTSGLNLSKEVVGLILDSGLVPKTYTKTGEYITIMVPVANTETTASVIVITAAQARILNIDKADRAVGAASTIDRANQRGDILKLILE